MKSTLEILYSDYQRRRDQNTPKALTQKESELFGCPILKELSSKELEPVEKAVAGLTAAYEYEGFKAGFKLAMGIIKEI